MNFKHFLTQLALAFGIIFIFFILFGLTIQYYPNLSPLMLLGGLFLLLYLLWREKRPQKEVNIVAKTLELDPEDEDVYSLFLRVVGVSFANDDGSKRQTIIKKYAQEGEPVYLRFYNYKRSLACAVYVDEAMKRQIGHISKADIEELYEIATSGVTMGSRISSIVKGSKDLYGVELEILVDDS